jgi:predicted amidohydrolase YtcJ
LVDSHVHLLDYGWSRTLNLDGARTIDEVIDRVREYVIHREVMKPQATAGGEEWIEGAGWDQNKWDNWTGGFPTHVRNLTSLSHISHS